HLSPETTGLVGEHGGCLTQQIGRVAGHAIEQLFDGWHIMNKPGDLSRPDPAFVERAVDRTALVDFAADKPDGLVALTGGFQLDDLIPNRAAQYAARHAERTFDDIRVGLTCRDQRLLVIFMGDTFGRGDKT